MIFPQNAEKELSYELFKNPTAEYRGLPFWSWNCKLNKATIDEQLEIFKEMGFGGVVIHPRDGLDTEYLGEEFMEMIKHTVNRCRNMGLVCWLYDDDRFPSGAADGYVTKNPQFRARSLRLTTKKPEGAYCRSKTEFDTAVDNGQIPRGYYCTAYSIKITDKKLTDYRRLNNDGEIAEALNNGEKVRFAYVELQAETEWFQGKTYSDTMNPAAVDEFINITHERYKDVLGADFGTVAPAIFTDEPRIGKQVPISGADSDEDVFVPYTDYFAEQFRTKYDFDALDIIPEYIWNRADGDMYGRYIYREMTKECFSVSFMDRICDWCNANGILMTGHILGEENLTAQTTTVGDAMRTYKKMDIPGIDILIDNRELSTVKQAASVAAQYGREGVMSELYGVTNWDCTFKTYKLQGDWQAALGISIRIPHLSHMSLEGEAKRDWPASIFYQSPWYKEYPYIEDHFARLNTVLTRGRRVTKIAVLHPVESMWIESGSDDVTKENRKALEKNFRELTEWLLYGTLDFDYLSESLLTEQTTAYSNKLLNVGESTYGTVIVPNLLTVRNTTLDILQRFAENGGNVIFMGDIPGYVNGSYSARASELAERCVCIRNDKKELFEILEHLRDVRIAYDNGNPADNLFYHLREDNECKWMFISHVNKKGSTEKESYTVKINGEYSLVLYDTMTGEKFNLKSHTENGYTVFNWDCFCEDSILLQLNKAESNQEYCEVSGEYQTVQKTEEITSFNRTEPNVLLLDYARFCVGDGEIQEREEILRAGNKIRKQLGFTEKTGADRQPWAAEVTGEHRVSLFCDIYSEIAASVQLGIENPQKCSIYLNGEKADNTVVDWYVDKSIRVINLPCIKAGKNELHIELMYNEKTMLENMYLLGDFDVKLEECRAVITKKRSMLALGDITGQGMPFYTGNLEYVFEIDIAEIGEYFIKVPEFIAPVIGVYIDGESRGLIAYSPHRVSLGVLGDGRHKLKLVLYGNRFNGFGAVHNANENYVWYGNGSYRTTGKEWTDSYMLRPVGIMSEIEIERNI